MGYAISWLAVRQDEETAALAALELIATHVSHHEPDAVHPWYATRTTAGWTVIWSNLYAPERFATFAEAHAGDVIVCDVEEHAMAICLEAYRDGELLWRVEHDAQEGAGHLYVEGAPPPEFAAIRAEILAALPDPEVDRIFEIPVRLGEAVVGFKHVGGADHRFELLRLAAPARPVSRPWWKLW
ncbi:MAG: hypothetical protein IT162_00285 [Bryobacterales bacterium]|nr:hypothetical protein [Bryobacterales bacterium]